MPRLSVSLTMLFNEVDFLDRFGAAARAGFKAVEYMFPYGYDKHVLQEKLIEYELTQITHNLPAGNWAAGDRGIACIPGRIEEFRAGIRSAIEYATALGCARLNCLAGISPPGVDPNEARKIFISNLQYAAPRLKDAGLKLTIEPVNTHDLLGFFLSRTGQALEIIEAVGSDNLFLQADIYHMQMMGEEVSSAIEQNLNLIQHIQLADAPGRHEPGTGMIDFYSILKAIDRGGYAGWVGCEYRPTGKTDDGLEWARPYLSN